MDISKLIKRPRKFIASFLNTGSERNEVIESALEAGLFDRIRDLSDALQQAQDTEQELRAEIGRLKAERIPEFAPDPQVDTSYTGIIAQQKERIADLEASLEKLHEVYAEDVQFEQNRIAKLEADIKRLNDRLEKKDTALENCHMGAVKKLSELSAYKGYAQDLEAALRQCVELEAQIGCPGCLARINIARKALPADEESP